MVCAEGIHEKSLLDGAEAMFEVLQKLVHHQQGGHAIMDASSLCTHEQALYTPSGNLWGVSTRAISLSIWHARVSGQGKGQLAFLGGWPEGCWYPWKSHSGQEIDGIFMPLTLHGWCVPNKFTRKASWMGQRPWLKCCKSWCITSKVGMQ